MAENHRAEYGRAEFSPAERIGLIVLAIVSLVGINGVFLWSMTNRPDALQEAMANPVSAAFLVEALVLVLLLAWLFRKWGVSRLGWVWFVLLSFVGSLAFAIPFVLLFPRRGRKTEVAK
jgi:cytochrome bd-type quinol oxidase subunit 2